MEREVTQAKEKMTTLITLLGTGKGTWIEVHALLKLNAFENQLVFIDEWAARDYRNEYNATLIPIPSEASTEQLLSVFKQHLKAAVPATDFDIALNIASGSGKQHAALLSAAITSGYGIRLVTVENNELKVLT
jgi:hypothetical protein